MESRSGFIKFDPEKILEMSVVLDRQHKLFTQYSTNIKKKADSLKSIWQSDSATLYAEKIEALDTKSIEIGKRLLSLSQDLANASGIYRKGETGAKQEAERLPTDGVFLV